MINKRGQLSIETLILYGLIILVALSAVAALIYFNVLNLGGYLPDKCNAGGTGDMNCEEMAASSSAQIIALGYRNTGSKPITNLNVTIDDEEDVHFTGQRDAVITYPPGSSSIGPGQIVKVEFVGMNTLKPDQSFNAKLITRYQYVNGAITQESTGSLRIKVS